VLAEGLFEQRLRQLGSLARHGGAAHWAGLWNLFSHRFRLLDLKNQVFSVVTV
jgi:hypothetical protein